MTMGHASYMQIIAAGNHGLYTLAVAMGGIVGAWLIRSDAREWKVKPGEKRNIYIACLVGSLLGSALPAFIAGDFVEWQAFHFLIGPKTIIGGLLFGFVFVALYKRLAAVTYDTSDAFARGTALMMAIGRLGCFAGHCCFGQISPTFGMDFGDGVPRIPIQLIESAFLFSLFFLLNTFHRRHLFLHRRFFLLFVVYGMGRFVLELWRAPISSVFFGINFYQWLALLLSAVGLYQIAQRNRLYSVPSLLSQSRLETES